MLPVAYAAHLLEEYLAGVTLPVWLNTHMGADLSNSDFLWINSVAMAIVLFNAVTYQLGHGRSVVLVAIVFLFTLNGVLHGLGTIYWGQYAPGTVTGLAIYLPFGALALYWLSGQAARHIMQTGITVGLIAHAVVIIIARGI